jgi:hypothetical protein
LGISCVRKLDILILPLAVFVFQPLEQAVIVGFWRDVVGVVVSEAVWNSRAIFLFDPSLKFGVPEAHSVFLDPTLCAAIATPKVVSKCLHLDLSFF